MKETITLNTHEQKRVLIFNRVQAGDLSVREAAELFQVSERHTRRMLAAYRKEGVAALAHGNRGRQPAHTIASQVREQVLSLARTRSTGANQSHLRDLLQEREGIVLSRATVRRMLLEGGLISGREKKRRVHRRRRQRFAKARMLVQLDGSPHAWLQERGPRLSL